MVVMVQLVRRLHFVRIEYGSDPGGDRTFLYLPNQMLVPLNVVSNGWFTQCIEMTLNLNIKISFGLNLNESNGCCNLNECDGMMIGCSHHQTFLYFSNAI